MKKIKKGQIWAVSDRKDEQKQALVLTIGNNNNNWSVVPVHENLFLRTEIDPLIEVYSEKLKESFEITAIVHHSMSIPETAFKENSYFGLISESCLNIVKEKISEYWTATLKLAQIQLNESVIHDFEEGDNDISPITSGIFELCPVEGCDLDELIQYNDEIINILEPWHILAMAEMLAEEEVKQASEVAEKRSKYGKSIPEKIIEIITELIPEPVLDFGFRGSETKKMSFKTTVVGVGKRIDLIIMIEKNENRIIRAIQSDVDKIEIDCSGKRIQFKKIGTKWVPEKEVVIENIILIMVEKEGGRFEFEINLEEKE